MKIALLFPGYGSQFVGMGKELYDDYRIVQEYFEEAANCLDHNFVKLCFASSDIELSKMDRAYASIFLVSSAIYAVLKEIGVEPALVAGYNIGEYSALFAAGSITLPDGLYLINKFAGFYEKALETMQIDVIRVRGIDAKRMKKICMQASADDAQADIAIYNSDTDHVISGHTSALVRVRELSKNEDDAIIEDLSPEIGLYSNLMQPIADEFKIYLEKVDFKDVKIPMISGIDGRVIIQGEDIKQRVVAHITSPIMWARVLEGLQDVDLIIEVGPGNTLEGMITQMYPEKKYISINKRTDIEALKTLLPQTEVIEQTETTES
ncbi:MAG TPA: ACP S-malonyltransferase [Candidatus Dependentiae bacterium]|nr:ACP S-malonyltransferase [Candidatus Dependentiae bacterium]HRQ62545.1 ACP S-malonyltransferase [Candidatus Dependentiae bacterium]